MKTNNELEEWLFERYFVLIIIIDLLIRLYMSLTKKRRRNNGTKI